MRSPARKLKDWSRRDAAVVLSLILAAVVPATVVGVAPPAWAFATVVAFALALFLGVLGAAVRVKPSFDALGKAAAAGAVGMVAMNAVRPFLSLAASDFMFLAAGLILIPRGFSHTVTAASVPKWLVFAVALILPAGVLASVGSLDPAADLSPVIQFVVALLFVPLVVGFAADTPRLARLFATLFVLSAAISGAVGLVDLVGSSGFGTALDGTIWFGRAVGLSVHPNHLALTEAMSLPIAYALAVTAGRATERLYLGLLILPIVAALLASGSRSGLIFGIAGLTSVVLIARGRRNTIRGLIGVAVLGALAIGISSVVGGNGLLVGIDRLTGAISVGESDLSRLDAYSEALGAFVSSPLVGTGFSSVRDAHDLYLQLLEAGGLLALGGFAVFAIGALRAGWVLSGKSDLPHGLATLAAGVTGSTITWLAGGLVQNQIYDRYLYVPCGLVIGIGLYVLRSEPDHRRQWGSAWSRPPARPEPVLREAGRRNQDGSRAVSGPARPRLARHSARLADTRASDPIQKLRRTSTGGTEVEEQ